MPVAGPVMFTITHFYDNVEIDADNLPKPIIDALKGLVFLDDSQLTDLICRKRSLSNSRVISPSGILNEGLRRSDDFLHIVITEAPDQEVLD